MKRKIPADVRRAWKLADALDAAAVSARSRASAAFESGDGAEGIRLGKVADRCDGVSALVMRGPDTLAGALREISRELQTRNATDAER